MGHTKSKRECYSTINVSARLWDPRKTRILLSIFLLVCETPNKTNEKQLHFHKVVGNLTFAMGPPKILGGKDVYDVNVLAGKLELLYYPETRGSREKTNVATVV